MFYRAFVVGIVLFWVWMTALLVRFEYAPGEAQTLPVPTARVWDLLFEHEELSALTLFNGRQRLGELYVQPRKKAVGGGSFRQLSGTGTFALDLPGLSGERMVFHGTMDLDDQSQIQHVELAASFHEPNQPQPGTTVTFDGQPPQDHWHYVIRQGSMILKENAGTVDHLLDDPDLRALGFDPKVFGQVGRQQVASATLTARHGTLHINGEDLESFVVIARQSDGPESSIYLNQLGRILAVKTFLGYDLYDAAFTP